MKPLSKLTQPLLKLHQRLSHYNKYYWLTFILAIGIALLFANQISHSKFGGDDHVTVTVQLKLQKNDELKVYYIPDTASIYSEQNSIGKEIIGSDRLQSVEFELPDTLIINQIRLDVGNNRSQKNVYLKLVRLTYNGASEVLYDANNNINLFQINEFLKAEGEGHYTTETGLIYDPFFYSSGITSLYSNLINAKHSHPKITLACLLLTLTVWLYLLLYTQSRPLLANFYTVASCLFVLALLLPSLNSVLSIYKDENREKRKLAERPTLASTGFAAYPAAFDAYYNDNFGFRSLLVEFGGKLKYNLFGTSNVPAKVAVGKEGWLYLNGRLYSLTQDLTRENLFTEKDLASYVLELEKRKNRLAKDSIYFLRSFFPDKQYIYPEYMPFCMQIMNKDTIHCCDQVLSYLQKNNSSASLVDVRPTLLSAKKKNLVYQKLDSHWNAYGAYLAFETLMKALSKDVPNFSYHPISDYNITWNNESNGDLSAMMGIAAQESLPTFTLKTNVVSTSELPATGYPKNTRIFINQGAHTSYTLLMYRDSFTEAMTPFLNQQFSKVVFIWDHQFYDEVLEKVKPDIVMEAFATRYFH